MKITSRVINILKELSRKEDIQITDDLQTDICLDSLELVQLLIEIENEFEIILNESDLNPFDLTTVKDVVDLVERYVDGDEKMHGITAY